MHDCTATQEQLTAFAVEGRPPAGAAAIELQRCPACREAYSEMRHALALIDDALEAAAPEEEYWTESRRRLREKLARPPRWWHALLGAFRQWVIPAVALPATAVLLVVVGLVPSTAPEPPGAAVLPPVSETFAPQLASLEGRAPRFAAPSDSLDLARHLEAVELLICSVKNSRGTELAYEKRKARLLLARHRLLQRAAEIRGQAELEDLLARIEPVLLDIAHLPAGLTADDVDAVRGRLQNTRILTTVRFYVDSEMAIDD